MSQVFAKFGNPEVEGNTRNFYIVLTAHKGVDQLTLSLTFKGEEENGFGSSKVEESRRNHCVLCISGEGLRPLFNSFLFTNMISFISTAFLFFLVFIFLFLFFVYLFLTWRINVYLESFTLTFYCKKKV